MIMLHGRVAGLPQCSGELQYLKATINSKFFSWTFSWYLIKVFELREKNKRGFRDQVCYSWILVKCKSDFGGSDSTRTLFRSSSNLAIEKSSPYADGGSLEHDWLGYYMHEWCVSCFAFWWLRLSTSKVTHLIKVVDKYLYTSRSSAYFIWKRRTTKQGKKKDKKLLRSRFFQYKWCRVAAIC